VQSSHTHKTVIPSIINSTGASGEARVEKRKARVLIYPVLFLRLINYAPMELNVMKIKCPGQPVAQKLGQINKSAEKK